MCHAKRDMPVGEFKVYKKELQLELWDGADTDLGLGGADLRLEVYKKELQSGLWVWDGADADLGVEGADLGSKV